MSENIYVIGTIKKSRRANHQMVTKLIPIEHPIGYVTLTEAQTALVNLLKGGLISEDKMMGENSEGYFFSIISVPASAVDVVFH